MVGRWVPKLRPAAWLSLAALGLVLVGVAPKAVGYGAESGELLRRAEGHLLAARQELEAGSLAEMRLERVREARGHLAQARDELGELRRRLGPAEFLLRHSGGLPLVGAQLSAAPALLTMAFLASDAGVNAIDGLAPALNVVAGEAKSGGAAELVAVLRAGHPYLREAQGQLQQAAQERRRLDRRALTGPLARAGPLIDEWDRQWPRLERGMGLLVAAPELLSSLLGLEGPKAYLILGQGEDERRATGGFVGSMGLVTVDQGQVASIDYRRSYDFDNPRREAVPPPEPLAKYMGAGAWYIRDANWFPDFPTTAAQVEWFWARDYGGLVDGIIAFDQEVVRVLLEALGPVDLPAYGERIEAANFKQRTLYWLYEAKAPGQERQFVPGAQTPFMAELAAAIVKRLKDLKATDAVRLGPALLRALAERHLLLSFRDSLLARWAAEQKWDGRLLAAEGDYLYVVDSTTSYSKVAPLVEQSLEYEVMLGEPGQAQRRRLTLTYENNYRPEAAGGTYPRLYMGEYWNRAQQKMDFSEGYYATYIRVYIPQGSILLGARGFGELTGYYEEGGKAVLANHLVVKPGEKRLLEFDYVVPEACKSRENRLECELTVQKQPGTAWPLRVVVRPPGGWSLGDASPPAASVEEHRIEWRTDLRTDRTFKWSLSRGGEG